MQLSDSALQQAQKFNYLGVEFAYDGRRNKMIDTLIVIPNVVLCELYRSVVSGRRLPITAKLSVFRSFLCVDPHLWS